MQYKFQRNNTEGQHMEFTNKGTIYSENYHLKNMDMSFLLLYIPLVKSVSISMTMQQFKFQINSKPSVIVCLRMSTTNCNNFSYFNIELRF